MSTPAGTCPMPAVFTYTWSPWPASTTLVSPVTMLTPAARAASPMSWATRPITDSSVPSSSTKPQERYAGTAPLMARSLRVPFTARWPIEPPGKNSGRTTKVSVENASRTPPISTTAESVSPPPASPAERRHEEVLDQFGRHLATAAVTHRRRAGCPAAAAGRSSPRSRGPCRSRSQTPAASRLDHRQRQPAVQVVGRTGALAGHHGGAERIARRALLAERCALVRLDQPLQHLAAAADRRLLRCRCR